MLIPYPTDLPAEVLTVVMDVVKKAPVDRNQAIHCGYHLLGFTAGKLFPDGPKPVGVMRAAPTDLEAISILEKLRNTTVVRAGGQSFKLADAASISWEDVLMFVLNFLLRIASGELCPCKPQVTP